MSPTTQRARHRPAALAKLMTVAATLGPDELRVLASIARRLSQGESEYGRLNLRTDRRDFAGKEAREELEDFLVYVACAHLREGARHAART